jgi:hypothetical protein
MPENKSLLEGSSTSSLGGRRPWVCQIYFLSSQFSLSFFSSKINNQRIILFYYKVGLMQQTKDIILCSTLLCCILFVSGISDKMGTTRPEPAGGVARMPAYKQEVYS